MVRKRSLNCSFRAKDDNKAVILKPRKRCSDSIWEEFYTFFVKLITQGV